MCTVPDIGGVREQALAVAAGPTDLTGDGLAPLTGRI
jgi:hypothetical protein